MKLRCSLFGHLPAFGYGHQEGAGYFEVVAAGVDGINRHHADLYCNCERCGERYRVGKIHIPNKYVDAISKQGKVST